jgi:hypothetical protein
MKTVLLIIVLLMLCRAVMAPVAIKQLYILKSEYESKLLTWSNIDWWLNYYQVQNIEIVKHQIRLETGNLTSKYCRENSNLFGMKLPQKRSATAIGRLDGMAYYDNWIMSIADYKLWQDRYYKGGDYYTFLTVRRYAEDPFYIRKLKQFNT